MSDKKTISINPDLFSFTSTAGTRKRKPKQSGDVKEKPPSRKKREDSLKKRSILKMIRQRQEDMYKSMFDKTPQKEAAPVDSTLNKEFKEAELFFQNLTERKEEEKKKNATIKRYPAQPQSLLFHPSMSTLVPDENINLDLPSSLLPANPITIQPRLSGPVPQYGCLKNGSLPTYRSYMNQTRKVHPPVAHSPTPTPTPFMPTPNFSIGTAQTGGSSGKEEPTRITNYDSMKRVSEILQTDTKMKQLSKLKAPTVKKQRKIRTRTYKVGKSKALPKIGVLVSNKTIRNKVSTQTQLLKQVPIQDVKKHLMKRGLIKVGSTAPQDVLRKMYESSVLLCGEVQNHNPDNLLYNFIYGEGAGH
jgi:hypothetical protein